MNDRFHRQSLLAGPAAVLLWIVGLVLAQGVTDNLAENAPDAQILAWAQGNTNEILLGGWLFMLGCVAFVWFAATLRAHYLAADGGPGTLATLAFAGSLATAAFGMLMPAGDVGLAIDKDDVSAATAGALHHSTDAFFVGAELSAVLLMVASAILVFRSRILPKWWGAFCVLLAVVLVIGPIGWAGLIFGLPVWTLGTTAFLTLRRGERAEAAAPAAA